MSPARENQEGLGYLLRLSLPLVISFWIRSLFSLVDTLYASFLSDEAIAAIGLTIPIEFALIGIWVGISAGLTSYLSKGFLSANQARDYDAYLRVSKKLILYISPITIVAGTILYFIIPQLELTPEVIHNFQIYGTVMLVGSGVTGFWSIIPDSIVKAHHDTRSTMIAGLLSNGLNVTLNTIFLFVFHWGIFGIAFSTVLGRIAGLAYALWRSNELERRRKAKLKESASIEPSSGPETTGPLPQILFLAIPSGLSYVLMSLETSIVNFFLSDLPGSTPAIAAYAIFYRVMLFAMMPMIASTVAVLPFVARLSQQKQVDSIRSSYFGIMRVGMLYCMCLVFPVVALTADLILNTLTDSQTTIFYGRFALLLVPWFCLSSIPHLYTKPLFEAFQYGKPVMALAIIRYLGLSPLLCFAGKTLAPVFNKEPFDGVMIGLTVATLLSSLVSIFWGLRSLRARKTGA